MKVLVSAWGSTGDVLPPIAVGAALRRRGHDVSFAGNPYFERVVRQAGLTMVPVGAAQDHQRMMDDVELFDASRKSPAEIFDTYYFPQMQEFHAVTDRALRDGVQVLVGGELGSTAAAEQHRVPWVLVACSPSSSHHIASRRDPPHPEWHLPPWARPLARHGFGLALYYRLRLLRAGRMSWPEHDDAHPSKLPAPTRFRASIGLQPMSRFAPQHTLCMWPDWFAPAQADWPPGCQITGFPYDPLPRAMPGSGAPPIVVTTGSTALGQQEFLARAAAACSLIGQPALLVTPHADNVPADLPRGVTHLAHAPFSELLGRAALVVHHGGIGTISYALAAAVPQLMTPMRGDQFDNANRVQRLGVGAMLPSRSASVPEFAAQMRHLLASVDVARRCREIQRRIVPAEGLCRAAEAVEAAVLARALLEPSP